MTLKTLEDKKNAITWLVKQLKAFGVVAGITITLIGSGMWYVISKYLDGYVDTKVHSIIDEKNGKKSFREVLGEQLNVPTDAVPYYLSGKLVEVDSLFNEVKRFEESYIPFLDKQMTITVIYRYLDENGDEWWHGYDNRDYRVNYTDGTAWVIYHGFRKDL